MTLKTLYEIADEHNTKIYNFNLSPILAMSMLTNDGNTFIGIDQKMIYSEVEERVVLAHELGHCETGSFYNIYSTLDIKSKHEYKADKWAVKNLVPFDDLIDAIQSGCENVWQLSEHFEVTEDFIRRALEIHNLI